MDFRYHGCTKVYWKVRPDADTVRVKVGETREEAVNNGARIFPGGALCAAVCLCLVSGISNVAFAQRFLAFGGLEGRIGVANPDEGQDGTSWAIDLDLGSIFLNNIRTYVRLESFTSDAEVGGSFTGNGIEPGLRIDVPLGFLKPYGVVGFQFASFSTENILDPELSDEINGGQNALAYGLGIGLALPIKFWLTGDYRWVGGDTVGRQILSVGLRWRGG